MSIKYDAKVFVPWRSASTWLSRRGVTSSLSTVDTLFKCRLLIAGKWLKSGDRRGRGFDANAEVYVMPASNRLRLWSDNSMNWFPLKWKSDYAKRERRNRSWRWSDDDAVSLRWEAHRGAMLIDRTGNGIVFERVDASIGRQGGRCSGISVATRAYWATSRSKVRISTVFLNCRNNKNLEWKQSSIFVIYAIMKIKIDWQSPGVSWSSSQEFDNCRDKKISALIMVKLIMLLRIQCQ